MARLASLRRSFPTFYRMAAPFLWIVGSRRRVLGVVLAALTIAAVPPLWWATQLVGLPDVGEPFDVRAFRATTIPDDRNAFVPYRQAMALLKPRRSPETASRVPVDPQTRWSTTTPENRRWAETNREALALYRRGADRPDALDPSLAPSGGSDAIESLRAFQLLALLEASRLEEQGDMPGAWGWYRANLRMIHHFGSRGTIHRRMTAQVWHDFLRKRVAGWAADPRTTPAQLRQALDDALACGAMTPSDSYTLKIEYLNIGGRMLSSPWTRPWWQAASPMLATHLTPEQKESISDALSFLLREPERRRRLVRLATANRLAFFDLPPDERPGPDPSVVLCDLYPFGPDAPAKARALSPEALGGWIESTEDAARSIEFLNLSRQRFKEITNHRELVVLLATQLYRRDHGADPPKPEALVGPYLESLPPDHLDGERDEAIPVFDMIAD